MVPEHTPTGPGCLSQARNRAEASLIHTLSGVTKGVIVCSCTWSLTPIDIARAVPGTSVGLKAGMRKTDEVPHTGHPLYARSFSHNLM